MENFNKEPLIITENNAESKRQYVLEKRDKALSQDDFIEVTELIGKYSDKIKEKYPDWKKYQLFHVLIGSTFREDESPFLDFPSPDSVEEFIETLSSK